MKLTRIRTAPLIAAFALALLVAAPATTVASSDGPVAAAAKKGKKKKKKRKKGRPAPGNPGPGGPSVPGGPGPANPTDPEPTACEGEDTAEPNDTLLEATPLAFPGEWDATAMHVCPGDSDFFRVDLPAGRWNHMTVDPADGLDLMMRLYSPDGAAVYTANLVGAGVYEELNWSNSTGSPARWSVEVKATNATQAGDYALYSYELAR